MPIPSHSSAPCGSRWRRPRRALLALALATAIVASMPAASLASTGIVFFDAQDNLGAGGRFIFNGSYTGQSNVGVGVDVMPALTSGGFNTAIGDQALIDDTAGDDDVASGDAALQSNTSGNDDVATGGSALVANTTGDDNIATGFAALGANTSGADNIATGFFALGANTTGHDNLAVGRKALDNATGNSNIALGFGAGQNLTTGSDNIDIANQGKTGEQKAMRIGTKGDQTRTFIAGISGRTVSGTGQPVVVNAQGQLGTASAAARSATSKASTDHRLARIEMEMKRLRRQNRRQGKEIKALRAPSD